MSNEPIFLDVEVKDVTVGKGVRMVRPCNVYGCHLGDDVFVGPFVEIQKGAKIGARTRIQSHSFVCDKVTIGEDCFVAHGVIFINDLFKTGGFSQKAQDWKATTIGNRVSIGGGCKILPVSICDDVIIGAGSVVTRDITEPGTYFGNPARRNSKTQIPIGKEDGSSSGSKRRRVDAVEV